MINRPPRSNLDRFPFSDEEKMKLLRIIHDIIRDTTPRVKPKHDDPAAVFDPVVPAGTQQLKDFMERRKRQ